MRAIFTRGGLDGLLSTGQIRVGIYAMGSKLVAPTVTLPEGWARNLIKTGKLTIGSQTMDTAMGQFGRAKDGRMLCRTDHNDHIHISLNVK